MPVEGPVKLTDQPSRILYPGTFDPPTHGHIDLVQRSLSIFDQVIVAILANPAKKTLFSVEERVEMLRDSIGDIAGVEIDQFDGLLVNYARLRKCHVILRGLRAVSDFEYEFQMALVNRRLDTRLETLYLMPSEQHVFVSSRVAKEVAQFGGDLTSLVPECVERCLKRKYNLLK